MKTKATTILLMLFLVNLSTSAQVLEQDSLALVAFYNSTGGPGWNNNTGWLTRPVSTWYGVTVEEGRVIELSIYSNNLIGNIPQEVENLTSITKFTLGHHPGLGGNIPEIFDNYSQIKIFGIGNCSNLSNLSLWENNLTGPIPPEIGNLDSLRHLDFHDNQLNGSIPPEIGNCTNLIELRLNNNQLTGNLPENLGSFFNNSEQAGYVTLDVSNNQLTDSIPFSWSDILIIGGEFDFSGNSFTDIPPGNPNWILNTLSIKENKMTFEDIESHFVGYTFYSYSPQDSMGVKIDTILTPGVSFSIYSGTGGEYTEYFWYRNGELILQSMEADTLLLNNVSYVDTGTYQCWAENSLATELTLVRRPVHIQLDTGTNITHNYLQKHIAVCPNPASEKITVYLPFETKKINISITNMQGKCVLKQKHKGYINSSVNLDIKTLEQGIYLLHVKTENKMHSTKLIINKRGTNR